LVWDTEAASLVYAVNICRGGHEFKAGLCARVVSLADGANAIAIVVPWHPVVGADASLALYGGCSLMKALSSGTLATGLVSSAT
jgi:hypothetical protein